MIYVYTARG